MSTTTAPTLAGDWVPDNQAICLKTNDVWQWDWGIAEDMRTVMGGPSQITQCLPSGWDSAMTYEGTKCPPRYTKACAADENQDWSAVVCCPTIHKFDCPAASNLASVPHASIFRCVSQYADTGILTMTRTFMKTAESTSILAESTSIVSASYGPSYHLFALGIIYATPTSTTTSSSIGSTITPTDSTLSSPSPSNSDESSSSTLSVGASVGIGVGVAAAAILLALFGWLLYRRKRKNSKLRAEDTHAGPVRQGGGLGYYEHGNADVIKSHTQPLRSELSTNRPLCAELPGRPPAELET